MNTTKESGRKTTRMEPAVTSAGARAARLPSRFSSLVNRGYSRTANRVETSTGSATPRTIQTNRSNAPAMTRKARRRSGKRFRVAAAGLSVVLRIRSVFSTELRSLGMGRPFIQSCEHLARIHGLLQKKPPHRDRAG